MGLIAQIKTTGVVNLGSRMTIKIDKNSITNVATFTITGPHDRWFAVSYRNTGGSLFNQDCIIVNSASEVKDSRFPGGAAAVIDPVQNITVISNTITGTTRTVVVERNFSTGDAADYTFTYSANGNDISWAIAPSATYNILLKHLNSSVLDRSFASLSYSTLGNESFNEKLESLTIYPNPVIDVLHLQNQNLLNISDIKIFNAYAQLIKELKLNSNDELFYINLSDLPSGFYFLEINNENDKSVKKIQVK